MGRRFESCRAHHDFNTLQTYSSKTCVQLRPTFQSTCLTLTVSYQLCVAKLRRRTWNVSGVRIPRLLPIGCRFLSSQFLLVKGTHALSDGNINASGRVSLQISFQLSRAW